MPANIYCITPIRFLGERFETSRNELIIAIRTLINPYQWILGKATVKYFLELFCNRFNKEIIDAFRQIKQPHAAIDANADLQWFVNTSFVFEDRVTGTCSLTTAFKLANTTLSQLDTEVAANFRYQVAHLAHFIRRRTQ